nr:hypothetical protein BaRGS_013704 [Batillaria attramentaria]
MMDDASLWRRYLGYSGTGLSIRSSSQSRLAIPSSSDTTSKKRSGNLNIGISESTNSRGTKLGMPINSRASTGIGACTAKFMAKYKPKLVLVARSPNKLQAVQKNCIEAGCAEDSVVTITADLGKHEDLGRVVSGAVSAFGQLDVLVNNAFAGIISNVEHTSPDAYDRCMAVNIRAPFFLSQAAMTHLKKTEGSIVNISSISAQMVDGTDTRNEAMLKSQPLGGACSMEDIAKMVTLLTSDLASAITGTCIPVDRGALLAASHQDAVGDFHNMGDYNSVPTEVKNETAL